MIIKEKEKTKGFSGIMYDYEYKIISDAAKKIRRPFSHFLIYSALKYAKEILSKDEKDGSE